MKKQKISLGFYIFMIMVSILNIVLQTINGTFYWGNIVVLIVFILIVAYKLYKIYAKNKLLFEGEQKDFDDEDTDEWSSVFFVQKKEIIY